MSGLEFNTVDDLTRALDTCLHVDRGDVVITNSEDLKKHALAPLLAAARYSESADVRKHALWFLYTLSRKLEAHPSSIAPLYRSRSQGRFLPKAAACVHFPLLPFTATSGVLKAMQQTDCRAFLFDFPIESIRFSLEEYAVSVLAAAIKTGYMGPVFLQASGLSPDAHAFERDALKTSENFVTLLKRCLNSGYRNLEINIDPLLKNSSALFDRYHDASELLAKSIAEIHRLQGEVDVLIGASLGCKNGLPEVNEVDTLLSGIERASKGYTDKNVILHKLTLDFSQYQGDFLMRPGGKELSKFKEIVALAENHYGVLGVALRGIHSEHHVDLAPLIDAHLLETAIDDGFFPAIMRQENLPVSLREEFERVIDKLESNSSDVTSQVARFEQHFFDMDHEEENWVIESLRQKADILIGRLSIADTEALVRDRVRLTELEFPKP